MNNQDLEPSVEVAHLRRLLDVQPGCLMRLGADGTVLAANDAALALVGVTSRAQVLGRDSAAWILPDQRDQWRAFTTGVAQGDPASIECDITSPSGDPHPTLFHGVPIPDHPDGVASLAVLARAVSGQRQLEAAIDALEEQLRERDTARREVGARLAEAEAGRRQLAETVAALEARMRGRETGSGEDGRVRQLSADLMARDEALAAADAARRTAETNRVRALADVQQLEVALEAFAAGKQPMAAGRAAEQAELEEARGDRLRLEADLEQAQNALARLERREQDLRGQRDGLQAQLDEALLACQERELALDRLETAHRDLGVAHEAATADHDRLVRALREHAGHLHALASGLPRAGGGPGAAESGVAPRLSFEEQRP